MTGRDVPGGSRSDRGLNLGTRILALVTAVMVVLFLGLLVARQAGWWPPAAEATPPPVVATVPPTGGPSTTSPSSSSASVPSSGAPSSTAPPSTAPPSSAPSDAATAQARAQLSTATAVLNDSAEQRPALNRAMDQVLDCSDVTAGKAGIDAVTQARRDELTRAGALDLSAVPDGEGLRRAMTEALQAALDNDIYLSAWAAEQNECSGKAARSGKNWQLAGQASNRAGAAKTALATRWNALATTYGLPTYTRGTL